MDLFAGTSGYSYKEWKGPFYPEDLAAGQMLGFYSGKLPAVEINNTFYRMPKRSVLENWASQVPEDFRFAIRASRRVTHFTRLKDAREELGLLLGNLEGLGARMGAVLFQLPPDLRKDLPLLDDFLAELPEGTPAAFELRHASRTENDGAAACIAARGFAVCIADTDDEAGSARLAGGQLGYLRLRRSAYDDAALLDFAERIRAAGWQRAFVFFKHEGEGAGPALAQRFLALAAEAEQRRRPRPVRRAAHRDRQAG